jgi:hypothetical protein
MHKTPHKNKLAIVEDFMLLRQLNKFSVKFGFSY